MFYAVYTDAHEKKHGELYDCSPCGYEKYFEDTFSPYCKIFGVVSIKSSGKTYKERKDSVRNAAIDCYELISEAGDISMGEMADIRDRFEKLGRRYGLLTEFRENAIC